MSLNVSQSDLYDQNIAFHNLIEGEKLKSNSVINASLIGWFKSNPESSLLDLEVELRNRDSNLYLIPNNNIDKDGKIYLIPNNFDIDIKYKLEYNIYDDENEYYNYLEDCETSQSDILEKLEFTGLEFDNDIDINKVHYNVESKDELSDELVELLCHCCVKIESQKIVIPVIE
jgi:hypothetical protein